MWTSEGRGWQSIYMPYHSGGGQAHLPSNIFPCSEGKHKVHKMKIKIVIHALKPMEVLQFFSCAKILTKI